MIRISKWQVLGLVPMSIIVYSGFVSHGNFKNSLVENFTDSLPKGDSWPGEG